MTYEKSCGAIVYRKHHGNTEILLIKHINNFIKISHILENATF